VLKRLQNPNNMHLAGQEIMAAGFPHVVSISNYHSGRGPNRRFVRLSDEFKNELKVVTEEDSDYSFLALTMSFNDVIYKYKGYKCMTTIQDGELRGFGLYVFFKTIEGAKLCADKWEKYRGS